MKLGGAFLCISLFVACGGNHAGHHHEEGEGEDEIFTGDIFEDFNNKK